MEVVVDTGEAVVDTGEAAADTGEAAADTEDTVGRTGMMGIAAGTGIEGIAVHTELGSAGMAESPAG